MAPETRIARSAAAATGGSVQKIHPPQKGIFRKEGEYWTVGYGGKSFRLKDTKG